MRSATVALCLVSSLLFPTGWLAAEVIGGVDTNYAGKFKGTAAFESLREAVVALRAESLTRIRASLGIFYNENPGTNAIVIHFLDADQARARGFPGASRAGVGEEPFDGRSARIVHLITDRFVSDCTDLPGVLTHEMVHAVMLGFLGDRYLAMPPWIQEGLAVYASGQGVEKVLRAIQSRDRTSSEELIDGLTNHREWIGDYAEDFLAFDFLRARFGEGAVKKFVESLMRAKDPTAALRSSTGLAPAEFERAAREYSLAAVGAAARTLPTGRAVSSPPVSCADWAARPQPARSATPSRSTQVEILAGPLYKVTDDRGAVTIVDSYDKIR